MQLSTDQLNAKNKIIKFLESKNEKMFLLKGSAGTGKSTLITNILSMEKFKKLKISLCATTHKAVSVLKKMELDNKDINYITIHKLLKIKRKIDNDGIQSFKTNIDEENYNIKDKSESIYYYDIIVVDECSMIEKELLNTIFKIQDKIHGKIIFIGDICQLPPVNEMKSSVFNYNILDYTLSEIMRYKGKIVYLCNDIRKLIFNKSFKLKLQNYKSLKH